MSVKGLLAHDPNLLTEAQLSGLVAELARLGGWTLRYHTLRSKGSAHGFPDWVFVHPGKQRILFAELKSEKGKPTDRQRAWLDGLSDVAGLEVYLWKPSDWTEIVTVLTGRKPITKAA